MATAETDRAKSGKFKSRYDKNALYSLVADVCRFVDPEEPEEVSQPDSERSRDLRPAEEAVGGDQADRARPDARCEPDDRAQQPRRRSQAEPGGDPLRAEPCRAGARGEDRQLLRLRAHAREAHRQGQKTER